MPLNLAVFGIDKANQIIEKYPDIEQWFIAGHSFWMLFYQLPFGIS